MAHTHIADATSGIQWPTQLAPRWALAALLPLIALVYWPGLRGGFVFDDYPNIINNLRLHVGFASDWRAWVAAAFSSPASDLPRPLAMLSFAVNHAWTGLDPYWMKLTNLSIHLANSVLVFVLVRRLLRLMPSLKVDEVRRQEWLALWVAAAWALNPINLMAVLYVVQRMESLCHLFVLAGLCLYLTGRQRQLAGRGGWWLVATGLVGGTSLGMLAKESAALLPLYAFALECTLLRFVTARARLDRSLMATYGVLLVLPAVAGLAWLLPSVLSGRAYANRSFTLGERLLTEARVVVDYLHWTLLPDLGEMSLYHDDYALSTGLVSPPATLLSIITIALLAGAVVWLRRRRPLSALGVGWFLSAHALTATIIPLDLVYEHRNYFASLGLCLVLADVSLLAPRLLALRRAGIALAMVVLAGYAGLTAVRAREWDSPLRFSLLEASKHPQSPRATYELARNYVVLTTLDDDPALVHRALGALQQAMVVPGASPLPEAAAIVLASQHGHSVPSAWWDGFIRKLSIGPIGPQEAGALASVVRCHIDRRCNLPRERMVAAFLAALSNGEHAEVMNVYGNYALNVLHDPALALVLWEGAAARAPNVVQHQVTLARMLIATDRLEAAAVHIERVRQLGRLGQNESTARELDRLLAEAGEEALSVNQ